jgi:glycosyltransferase involved in cell wall biosynthesis
VDYYKHQPEVVRAVAALRSEGLPVALDLIGEAYPPALSRLKDILRQVDPRGEFIRYHGGTPHEKLAEFFHTADGFIFASSCETFGIILLEAMAAGLPIACSSRSVLPEVLGSDGAYFDPEDPVEIGRVLRELMMDPNMRHMGAWAAYRRAQTYTWKSVAEKTFEFVAAIGPSGHYNSRITGERSTR